MMNVNDGHLNLCLLVRLCHFKSTQVTLSTVYLVVDITLIKIFDMRFIAVFEGKFIFKVKDKRIRSFYITFQNLLNHVYSVLCFKYTFKASSLEQKESI